MVQLHELVHCSKNALISLPSSFQFVWQQHYICPSFVLSSRSFSLSVILSITLSRRPEHSLHIKQPTMWLQNPSMQHLSNRRLLEPYFLRKPTRPTNFMYRHLLCVSKRLEPPDNLRERGMFLSRLVTVINSHTVTVSLTEYCFFPTHAVA